MFKRKLKISEYYSFFLFGPRLTGKSTWIRKIFPDARTVDFLSLQTLYKYQSRPELFYEEIKSWIENEKNTNPSKSEFWVFVDEVQKFPIILNEVHRCIEEFQIAFILTGSSARKLKRGEANMLAGRAVSYSFFPLTPQELGTEFNLDEMLLFGGLPKICTVSVALKRKILKTYVSTYLKEEIQSEGLVRNVGSFNRFLELSAECIGEEISLASMSREIGVKAKTISEYFQILQDTLIGFYVYPWKNAVRKQLAGSPKFYFFDCGVSNAIKNQLSDFPVGVTLGHLFEQWVIQQVRAILSYNEMDYQLYYWKTRAGNEVDLIIADANQLKLAIEIKSTVLPHNEHLSGLKSIQEEYPNLKTLLVTRQKESAVIQGIQTLPVLEFLKKLENGEFLKKI